MKYYVVKNFKYQVAEDAELDLVYEFPDVEFEWFSVKGKKIYIKKGYAWDGASGPTIDTKDTIIASLIHDCLYQAMRLGLLEQDWRKEADKELRDQIIKADGNCLRAVAWYYAVRMFGKNSAKKGNLQGKEIMETV